MELLLCKRWEEDLDRELRRFPELDSLSGSTVLITGATGLICSAVVDLLLRYNETHAGTIHIICAGRRRESYQKRFGSRTESESLSFIEYDATKEDMLPVHADYIIHGAGNASPRMILQEPVETFLGNVIGVYNLLRHAKEGRTKRVLYISSSEVYGKKAGNAPSREDELGIVDFLNVRSAYSEGKRGAENICASFAAEYGIQSVIARPGHIYGPTASPLDNRVSSAFAYNAARGEDIVMKSSGNQLRSYCYCADCATALLTILLKGQAGEAYNVSNPNSVVTIRRMAEYLAEAGNVHLLRDEPDEKEKSAFNPMMNSSLDSQKLLALGWEGLFDAKTGLSHTVEIIKSREQGKGK